MGKYLHNKTRTKKKATKEIIRIITFPKFKEYTGPLFKELFISPFDDINNEAIALSIVRYFNNNPLGEGGDLGIFWVGMCTQDSKLAPRSRKNFP